MILTCHSCLFFGCDFSAFEGGVGSGYSQCQAHYVVRGLDSTATIWSIHGQNASPRPTKTDKIRKPRNDSRNYRYIELPNELRALLVSDPECDEAAASMRVGVGSMSDPPKIPGLAHFTEHMLFQGSKRFPGTHDFFDFVHNHGGYTNAFTSKFSTVFSFSIGPGFLEPGLDRLADLFSAPLLKSENLLKEVNAVHSEYIIDLTDDGRRKHHLIRQTAKGGPFSNFTVGNLESLMERTKQQGIDPVKAMREFHNKWYSSNLMTLAVVGRESLDVLESHVRKHFGNVPNGRVTPPVFEECSEAFIPLDPNELGTETLVVPEADLHDATFVFYLPPQAKNWRSKPLQFISEMLEHEGPTSLSSKLKREGLITSLVTDYWSPELCTVLQVNVRLTEGGRSKESVYKIGHALFTFLRNLGVSRPERWRVTEMAKIRQLGFTFADMPDPYALTVRAVEGLNYYTPEEVIAGDRLIYHFDPDIIQQYVQKFLVPDNVRLFIFDKKLAADVDREEYWFKIKHGVEPIMDSVFKKWKEITSAPANTVQSMMRMEGMALPAPNRFLPNNVAILPRPPGSGQGAEKSAFPEPLVFAGDHICANKCAVFHKQDTTFHSPKAVVELQIYYTGSHEDGVRERILTALYVQSLRFALRERFADTHRAGMSLGLGSGVAVGSTTLPTVKRQRVLTLSAAGFSDKLDYVLRAFAKSLAATEGASDEKPIPSPMELGVTMSHGVRHLMHSRVTAPSNVLASVQSSRVYTTAVRLPGGGRAARRTLTHDQITTMHRKPASMDVTLMRTPVSSLGIRIVGGRAEREATPVVAGGGKPLLEKRFFRLAFDQLRTDLRVATLNRTPLAQANDAVLELIMHPHVPVHKMYAALFEMEKNHPTLDAIFEEVADWGVKLWNEAAVEGLVQGNITSESATQLEEEKLVQLRSIRKNLNPNDKKNQAYLLIEVGALPNIHDRAVLYMVSRWMSQRFFNKLRTEQQLGYLTAMHSSRLEDRFYYRFFITSTYDPAEVADRIVEFINAERSKIPTQEEFATLKQAAIDVWKQKPKNIFEEFRKNRRQVVLGDRLFDINERMVAELERVTPEEIQSFKEKTMFNASWLLMEVYSQREKPQMLPQANGASGESKLDPWVDIDPELLSNITVPDMESD
ncbi:rhoptry metalloprotease toxolysin TLN1 [Toxoplasma gondii]|uniref:Rhoptry metalloprotease toxolysin TLN1 n=1 Tax=Toxoplasma gondii TaxID=5811 RepID=A0A7J6K771_TOXGO|nr:rhoptry metalloprotease toxolysin TLN1 [Toxoplasma gondii]